MRGDTDLLLDADRNFIASYAKLAEHQPAGEVRRFGSVFAFVSGLPISIFNGAVVVEDAAHGDIAMAAAWLDERRSPYRFWVREGLVPDVARLLEAGGFARKDWVLPGMAIRSGPAPRPSPGIDVRAVDKEALEEHVAVLVATGAPEPIARSLCAPSFVADPDCRFFTAHPRRSPGRAFAGDPKRQRLRRLQRGHRS